MPGAAGPALGTGASESSRVREAALDALRPRARSGRGRALTILERSEKTYADFWVCYTPVCLELLRAPSDVAISISRDFLCSPGPVEPQVMLCREQCVAMIWQANGLLSTLLAGHLARPSI